MINATNPNKIKLIATITQNNIAIDGNFGKVQILVAS